MKKIKKYFGEIIIVIGSFLIVFGFFYDHRIYKSDKLPSLRGVGISGNRFSNLIPQTYDLKLLIVFGIVLVVIGILIMINKFKNK